MISTCLTLLAVQATKRDEVILVEQRSFAAHPKIARNFFERVDVGLRPRLAPLNSRSVESGETSSIGSR
jgi:hypothetical protein